jgi:hypothetical protein
LEVKRNGSYSGKKPFPNPDHVLHVGVNDFGVVVYTPVTIDGRIEIGRIVESMAGIPAHRAARGRVMIMGYDLPRIWSVTPFWEDVDSGAIRLAPPSDSPPASEGDDSGVSRSGMVIIGDPPVAVSTWAASSGLQIDWVDLRNFGWNPGPSEWDSEEARVKGLEFTRTWIETIRREKLGGLRVTAASQAFEAMRTGPFPWRIRPVREEGPLSLEMNSVYGGKCEANFVGIVSTLPGEMDARDHSGKMVPLAKAWGRIHHYDFTSLYPAVMSWNEFPVEMTAWHADVRPDDFASLAAGRYALADVSVKTSDHEYPIRKEGMVRYVTGTFRTILHDADLRRAVEHGEIMHVHMMVVYRTKKIFGPVIQKLWKLRLDARFRRDAASDAVYKSLMNSLSGKWNQRTTEWRDRPDMMATVPYGSFHADEGDGRGHRYFRVMAWHVQEAMEGELSRYSSPVITGAIHAYARERLDAAIAAAGRNHVYYYDTDSIFCDEDGEENLENAGMVMMNEMGFLRKIGDYERLEIVGPKHYVRDGVRVCAGIPPGSKLTRNGVASVNFRVGLTAAIDFGDPTSIITRTRNVAISSPMQGRTVRPDGWTIPMRVRDVVHDGVQRSDE